jgi:hemolysin activation/secretion protein
MGAYSNVKAGVTPTVAGPLFFAGRGTILGIKLTRRLESSPEWEHKLVLGLDHKEFRNDCEVGIFGSAGCGEAGASITLHPIGASYAGSMQRPAMQAQWNVSWSHNLPGGKRGSQADFTTARAESSSNYSVLRANASVQWPMDKWMLRLGGQMQESDDALVQAEQFGLGGAQSVRGYDERASSNDRGYAMNLELYTPELANWLNLDGSVRGLCFVDGGTLQRNRSLASETGETVSIHLTSVGIGLRASLGKNWTLSSDLGYILDATSTRERGSQRAHFNLSGTF